MGKLLGPAAVEIAPPQVEGSPVVRGGEIEVLAVGREGEGAVGVVVVSARLAPGAG